MVLMVSEGKHEKTTVSIFVADAIYLEGLKLHPRQSFAETLHNFLGSAGTALA